jgi:hypothetical protein
VIAADVGPVQAVAGAAREAWLDTVEEIPI